ncbi:MAG: cation:proton antiporter [bacterium]|nr:cation:proton antiporter [bacterium]
MTQDIFLDLSIVLGITAAIAFGMRMLRQPMLIAYLVAGIAVGPFFLNLIDGDAKLLHAFAEIGVVLLLFVVGLSLNFRHLREAGRSALLAGIGQFVFTAVIGSLLLLALALPPLLALYLAVAVTFSSTIIIVKLLSEKGDLDRLYGRQVIGLMVVQDLIAIMLLVLLSVLGGTHELSTALLSLVLRGCAVLLGMVLAARFVLPRILARAARSPEHLFLTTVTWCFVVASAVRWAGFSLEVGALAAGVSLAMSPYQPEIASRIRPLRDFFLVLFFVILGSTMHFGGMRAAIVPAAVLSAFILIGNPLILYLIYRRLHFTRRNSFFAGITAAQVSEFGFVLLLAGASLGHIGQEAQVIFTLTAITTIILSTYLVQGNERIFSVVRPYLRRFGRDKHQQETGGVQYDVWVFGYHRIGWKVVDALHTHGRSLAVVDDNPASIEKLRERGLRGYFGDASDIEFLEALPLDQAKLVLCTIPDPETQKLLLEHVRRRCGARVRIIATSEHASHLGALYAAGADYVTVPHLLGGTWLAGVLTTQPWTRAVFHGLRRTQHHDLHLRSRTAP